MTLHDVPVLGAALEMNGDDLYIGTSVSGNTVYLNVAEDLPRAITAFFQLMNVDLGELPVAAANQSMQQGYRRMQHLLPALAQTPPELLESIGSSIDWTRMVARINESLPETARETVTNQPDDCDPAVTVLSFALTKEQLIAICRAVLGETLMGLDNLFFGDEVLGRFDGHFLRAAGGIRDGWRRAGDGVSGRGRRHCQADNHGRRRRNGDSDPQDERRGRSVSPFDGNHDREHRMGNSAECGWRGCVLRGRPQSRPRTPELGAKQGANDVPTDEHGDGKRRDHADGSARH